MDDKTKERFFKKVVLSKETTCWTWVGSIQKPSGYGKIHHRSKSMMLAHRMSWQIHFGAIPENKCVLHSCDNRSCVNPKHLFIGSYGDNANDMVSKGRHGGQTKMVCKNGHPFTTENTVFVLSNRNNSKVRQCRICNCLRTQKHYRKTKQRLPRQGSESGR